MANRFGTLFRTSSFDNLGNKPGGARVNAINKFDRQWNIQIKRHLKYCRLMEEE